MLTSQPFGVDAKGQVALIAYLSFATLTLIVFKFFTPHPFSRRFQGIAPGALHLKVLPNQDRDKRVETTMGWHPCKVVKE
jgi:hypothetical protein